MINSFEVIYKNNTFIADIDNVSIGNVFEYNNTKYIIIAIKKSIDYIEIYVDKLEDNIKKHRIINCENITLNELEELLINKYGFKLEFIKNEYYLKICNKCNEEYFAIDMNKCTITKSKECYIYYLCEKCFKIM